MKGFPFAGPWRHRSADGRKGFETIAAELEMRAGRYADRYAGTDRDDFFVFAEPSPHAPLPRCEIPHLLDRAMREQRIVLEHDADALRVERRALGADDRASLCPLETGEWPVRA